MAELMNGTEQRLHRTATVALAERVEHVETCTVAMAAEVRQAVSAERTQRLRMAEEQRRYVDGLIDEARALRYRNLWGRLRWLVTGS